LGNARLDEAKSGDAKLLLAHCLDVSPSELFLFDKDVGQNAESRFLNMIDKRKRSIPVPYITGETEFMGLKFLIDENVLIPRQETEILVEEVMKFTVCAGPMVTVLDIGTGSGNIAVSLAKCIKNIKVVAVDISKGALELAKKNAVLNNVADKIIFWHTDILKDPFLQCMPIIDYDLIVSNPPYIKSSEISVLPAEVRHEPLYALDGGSEGMSFYEKIIPDSRKLLKKDGWLAMEIGHWHSRFVKKIMHRCDYDKINVKKDYSGEERVIYGQNCN